MSDNTSPAYVAASLNPEKSAMSIFIDSTSGATITHEEDGVSIKGDPAVFKEMADAINTLLE